MRVDVRGLYTAFLFPGNSSCVCVWVWGSFFLELKEKSPLLLKMPKLSRPIRPESLYIGAGIRLNALQASQLPVLKRPEKKSKAGCVHSPTRRHSTQERCRKSPRVTPPQRSSRLSPPSRQRDISQRTADSSPHLIGSPGGVHGATIRTAAA